MKMSAGCGGNTPRVRGVQGKEQSLWVGSDKKAEVRRRFTVLLLVFFRPNPTSSSVHLPVPTEPFAYCPGSGRRNQGRTEYQRNKGDGQGCVGEGW